MTIPAGFIWCPTCQEACHDHGRICTVCGDTLVHPPDSLLRRHTTSNSTDQEQEQQQQQPSLMVVPDHLVQQLRQSTVALQALVQRIRGDITETRHAQLDILHELQDMRHDWMQQQQPDQDMSGRRPTARETLRALPRISLQNNSHSLLRQASLSFAAAAATNVSSTNDNTSTTTGATSSSSSSGLETMVAIPGELGSTDEAATIANWQGVLVAAQPRTGGVLSRETRQTIQALTTTPNQTNRQSSNNINDPTNVILYMERGGGVTFVQKALLAQRAGAKAVVIGNNQAQPWPFVMRDSQNEASTRLTIPVVMVKQADGQAILAKCRSSSSGSNTSHESLPPPSLQQESPAAAGAVACALMIQPASKECVICTETLQIGHTVLQIPACGHVFHETCALQWLEHHNTCPYCRRELPTDDPDYEQERRRAQRTHAGSSGTHSSSDWNDFYG